MPRFTAKFRGFWFPENFLKYFFVLLRTGGGDPLREPSAPYDSYPPALEFLIDYPRCLPAEGVTGGT